VHRRNSLTAVLESLADSPVTLLHGARQVGKTTLVRDLLGARFRYVTLDSAAALAAASGDPEGFLAGFEGPLAIDEVQREPRLLRAIKARVDADRRPGQYLLTGSANVLTLPRISESLAGRMEMIRLWPLSQGELAGVHETFVDAVFAQKLALPARAPESRGELLDRAARGGLPEAVRRTDPRRRAAWFDSYVTSILHRDVRDLSNIEDLTIMPRLLRLLASRLGGLLNYADLGRTLSVPQSTLKRYFSLLEMTFLVQLVEPWSTNAGVRLVKSPKIHLVDTGLACALLGLDQIPDGHPAVGPMLESFVAGELTRQLGWSEAGRGGRLLHFRTQRGREVDLVLENRREQIVGVEVKAASGVSSADFAGLRELAELAGDRFVRGVVLHTGAETIPFGERLVAAPIGCLWAA
jgi:predicted AAA+ superfamily ATPase